MNEIVLITADGEPYAAAPDIYTAEKIIENGKKEKDWELIEAESIVVTKVAYYESEEELAPLTLGLKKYTICKFDLEELTPEEFGDPKIRHYDGEYCVILGQACDGYYNIQFCINEEKSIDAVSEYHLKPDTNFNYTELINLIRLATHYIKKKYNADSHGTGICTTWNIDKLRDCYFRIRPNDCALILVLGRNQYKLDDMKSVMKRYLGYTYDKIESIANGE